MDDATARRTLVVRGTDGFSPRTSPPRAAFAGAPSSFSKCRLIANTLLEMGVCIRARQIFLRDFFRGAPPHARRKLGRSSTDFQKSVATVCSVRAHGA